MAKWRLAKSLIKLRAQIDELYPNRNKASDGTISDLAHSKRVSDHNPDHLGRVTAMDITHSILSTGPNGNELSERLIDDPRVKYVIWSGRIWKARTGKWENYTGANQHRSHIHVSVSPQGADDDRPWNIGAAPVKPKYGDAVEFIKEFQRRHGLTVDGMPGPKTWGALG